MSNSERQPLSTRREFLTRLAIGTGAVAAGAAVYELLREKNPFVEIPTVSVDYSQLPDGTPLDLSFWNSEEGIGTHNNEVQAYTRSRENLRIEDGQLIIQARHQLYEGREYTSARINTRDKFEFTYGKLAIDARFPQGAGTWPAIWLRSRAIFNDAGETLNGEIDIAEGQGSRPRLVFANSHTYETKTNPNISYQDMARVPSMYEGFHQYGVEWTPDEIGFTLDGLRYHTVRKRKDTYESWPFDTEMYLVINLAMGGDWALDLNRRLNLNLPNGIDNSREKDWVLAIKGIKYYPLKKD